MRDHSRDTESKREHTERLRERKRTRTERKNEKGEVV